MTGDDSRSGELARVRSVYAAYEADARLRSAWERSAGSRLEKAGRWAAVTALLRGFASIPRGSWVLDLGAGKAGDDSLRFAELEPDVAGILAIDLLFERLSAGGPTPALLRPLVADGTRLPLAGSSVGLVHQATMLSSILRPDLRGAVFAEIKRVLRPGGIFISYDTRLANPWNRNTRPVPLRELRTAFAGWRQTGRSLTGIPQIQRLLAPWAPVLCRVVESVPALRSHRLFAAVKPGA
jgi:SAM-dependent methyltransferase